MRDVKLIKKDQYRFAVFGDSACQKFPDPVFQKVVSAMRSRSHGWDFVLFTGDHVFGWCEPEKLRTSLIKWRAVFHDVLHFGQSVYHATGNHTVYDGFGAEVWRSVFPELPGNGPAGLEKMSYAVRHGNLLLVVVHTASTTISPDGCVEHEWLDKVLEGNRDAHIKLVMGHHPVWPAHGFVGERNIDRLPSSWTIEPQSGFAFWRTLTKHRVDAYFCAHIIAYHTQVHDGCLQIISGGGGFLDIFNKDPDNPYRPHFLEVNAQTGKLTWQAIDSDGHSFATCSWPPRQVISTQWVHISEQKPLEPNSGCMTVFHLKGQIPKTARINGSYTALAGWNDKLIEPSFWIGITDHWTQLQWRVVVRVQGIEEPLIWFGPLTGYGALFELQIAIHRGLGPGGILYQYEGTETWTSFGSQAVVGIDRLLWPSKWSTGDSADDKLTQPDWVSVASQSVELGQEMSYPNTLPVMATSAQQSAAADG